MGYIITLPTLKDGKISPIGIEKRSRAKSTRVYQRYEQWPPEVEPMVFGNDERTSVEMDNRFLVELLAFFDNPENRRLLELEVPEPYPTGE